MQKNNPKNINYTCIIFIFILSCSLLFLLLTSISDSSFLWNKAYAHSLPVSQTPAHDSILKKEELPSKVIIDFSERPVPGISTIQVLNEKNERVDNGNFVIIGNHDREAMTTLDTKKLTDGVYTVSWMTQSADDGHIAKGSYVFGIGNVGSRTSAITSSSSSPSSMGLANHEQNYKVQAITSSLDGLIKWPLIISQVTVVGVIFSHLFLWELFGKRIIVNTNQTSSATNSTTNTNTTTANNTMMTLRYNKRFTSILVAVSVTIIISANALLFLQITELVPNNNNGISSYTSIFLLLLQGPSGFLWLIRIITSFVVIIVSAVIYYYYYLKKKHNVKDNNKDHTDTKIKKNDNLFSITLLSIAFTAGSISIFANSLTSHNAAVDFFPSIAVFLDWLHFMAISVWVGGLFYISTILLATIRDKTENDETIINSQKLRMPNAIFSLNVKKRFIFHYYLALLLPRFSLVATLSLGIIGISGIYMAWINIHNFNFLFNSEYGSILIIKLISVIPLILLGGYHQLKLHDTIVKVASLGENGENISSSRNDNIFKKNRIDLTDNPEKNTIQEDKSEKIKANKIDIFGKFSKTIKIESLVAIGVLLVASLLSTTSPPSASMNMPSMGEGSHTMVMPDGGGSGGSDISSSMSMSNLKNSSYVKEVKILNVTTKIEINPFYSGFNTFKITFTDSNGQPYSKILTVRMIFKNDQADIGPITAKLNQISPGIYAITGGYISQPGEWNVAIAAQRPSDYDLNYKFTSIVNSSSSSSNVIQTGSSSNIATENGSIVTNIETTKSMNMTSSSSQIMPAFDSFSLLTITLVVIIGLASSYFYKKSRQKLRETIDLLKLNLNDNSI
ncbi:MAG: copper resistance CopC/CopD family protein [Deltaproteobacteria bacterium]